MYILITFHLTIVLEGFILYKNENCYCTYAMGNIYMHDQPYEKILNVEQFCVFCYITYRQ